MKRLEEPPEGYSEYQEYTIPEKWILGLVLALTFVLGELFFPGSALWLYTQVNNDLTGLIESSAHELLFITGMVAVHETIHYFMGWKHGHNPTFGIRLLDSVWILKEPTPYVATFNEHITRNENITSLIAPLFVIDAIALISLLPIFPATVTYYAKIALVVNTASSMQDVYNVARLIRMSEEAKFINVIEDEIRSYYCTPLPEQSTSQ